MTRGSKWAFAVILAIVSVRCISLEADPPAWLSWSGGLLTDEGFYTLDARHLVLFGSMARGDFHDRLLSPLLSVLQEGVFRLLGAGILPARAISVVFGLLTICVFWWGMLNACGRTAAHWSAVLLGLMPPFVFYNRLALQETPTVFWLALAFALWVWGRKANNAWAFFAAGLASGAAVFCKTLGVVFLPALLWGGIRGGRSGWGMLLGCGIVLSLYGAFWYWPHQAEIGRMSAYYRTAQFVPHTWHNLGMNVRRGMIGDRVSLLRGVVPYLLAFAPAPFLLACTRLRMRNVPELVMLAWLGTGGVFCLLSSYAPDRYYVLFLPPLAGLASCALAGSTVSVQKAWGALFLLSSGAWLGAAWHGRTYSESNAGLILTRLLPPASVLIGDAAPALCLNTRFDAVPVQPGLSNVVRPVELLGATAIAVTGVPVYENWWRARYPQIVQSSHLLTTMTINKKTRVAIYTVKP